MANKLPMDDWALCAAAREFAWLFSWRFSPTVTSPRICDASVKNDGPYVRLAGASRGEETV